jgi:hypothetical protein
MKGEWLPRTTLRIASLLAPSDQRAEWIEEWRSELWYIPRYRATLFCMGAFPDALWLRRNNRSSMKGTGIHLESPLSCLALLTALAAVSMFITLRLTHCSQLSARDLTGICGGLFFLSSLLLPSTLWVLRAPPNRRPMPWPRRLRRGIFLALKIALVQPIVLCGFIVQILMGQVGGLFALGIQAGIVLAWRWIVTDQQRRCPVCLRLLGKPVRIGTPSQTFLEWYGVESTCSRGHGLLHTSEISSSYAGLQWLALDDSWSGLFAKSAGRHS